MNIGRASGSDLPAIRGLLAAASLPADDISESLLKDFIVVREGDRLVGAVGLERYGDCALLRSLVVAESVRGRGYGDALIREIEAHARDSDIASIYLLTTTAAPFFAARGYRPLARSAAPPSICRTSQFSTLCPASAVFMVKP